MLIPCSQSCMYQNDGCCQLNRASSVNGYGGSFCPYCQKIPDGISLPDIPDEILLPPAEQLIPREPRRLL